MAESIDDVVMEKENMREDITLSNLLISSGTVTMADDCHAHKKKKMDTEKTTSKSEMILNQVKCINIHCESGLDLTEAPVFALTYFGIRRRKNILQRVCNACYAIAENHSANLYTMLKNGEPLLRADFPKFHDDVVTMDFEEVISDEAPLSAEVTNMVEDNIETSMAKVLKQCNIDFQVKESLYILNEEMSEQEKISAELLKEFREIEANLLKVRNAIYDPFRPKVQELPPLDLNDPSEKFFPLPQGNAIPPITKPKSTPSCVLPPTEIVPNKATEVVALAEYNLTKKALVPGPIDRVPLVKGTPVYIIRSSTFGVWLRGKIVDVAIGNATLPYRVQFDAYRSGLIKSVSGRHLAYTRPSKFGYPVATRVIALFRNPQIPKENAYYVGIIAEPQKGLNKYRYLVFFDDGFAQYVNHEHILPVCRVSMNVVDDIHPQCRDFIKDYLNQYPERPMVRLQPGMVVRTEWDGKWWPAKVMQVDASLVKMDFENTNRSEWIYRGSTRLKPLYDQLVKKTRSFGASYLRKRNLPYVEYSREQNDENSNVAANQASPSQAIRNVAKKSTSNAPPVEKRSSTRIEKPINPLRPGERCEYASKGLIRRMDLSKRIKGRKYQPHLCNPTCVDWTDYRQMTSRLIPPLGIPLMVGFSRLLMKGKMKRTVIYEAPCGRKLRDMSELRVYLMVTACFMGYDLFDFDHWVRVTDEFHLDPSMYRTHIADISDGAENMAVSCVNEIQEAWPQVMKYSTKRLPQKGVDLNTDTSFMVCCDCTDDCFDKDKCACWQLTVQGTQQGPEGVDAGTVGYFYRRLHEAVNTGIYECHSGCSCQKQNCINRVVQQPLSQRLQVFRTLRKGWGLRTLCDIPSGAFICIYVGRLHTEASANEGGRVYGDEYLAELDYIEVMEQFKEGYESDVDDKDDEDYDEIGYKSTTNNRLALSGGSITFNANKTDNKEPETINLDDDDEDVQREMSSFTAGMGTRGAARPKPVKKSLRELLGDTSEDIYIMDAKYEGNIGRYLNHSCQPNVFVQNVFVDTHDVRFPWIAFFAMSHIRAGTELTWDYNYNIGSVPGKVLYCYCGTPECRGRLL